MIDIRSDTVTKPTPEMLNAMLSVEVGDDVYEEDPTVNEFEAKMARACGFEAALFCTCQTQSNLVAMLTHCDRGDEVIIAEHGHSFYYETGGGSAFAGVQMRPLAVDERTQVIPLEKIEESLRPENVHFPRSKLIMLENTHMGTAVEPSYFRKVRSIADSVPNCKTKVHCDGARICNAAVKLNHKISAWGEHLDSLAICMSKGLGAACGSVLMGTKEFVYNARRWRKAVGGGLRQVGHLAAMVDYAWETNFVAGDGQTMKADHDNAKQLSVQLNKELYHEMKNSVLPTFLKEPTKYDETLSTNMIFLKLNNFWVDGRHPEAGGEGCDLGTELMNFMKEKHNVILGNPKYTGGAIRIVTHRDFLSSEIEKVVAAFKEWCGVVAERYSK